MRAVYHTATSIRYAGVALSLALALLLSWAVPAAHAQAHDCQTISQKYASLPWLGRVVESERPTPGRQGTYAHYEHGSLYYSPTTCAHVTFGAVRSKWASLGWEQPNPHRGWWLGFPVTDHLPTPRGNGPFARQSGAYQHFEGGTILWSEMTGAFVIRGQIREKYASLGSEQGLLGFPLDDEHPTPHTAGFLGRYWPGNYQHFQGGSLYQSQFGTYAVYGKIRDRWSSLGWEQSYLGYPTSGEYSTSDGGRAQAFMGGVLRWHPQDFELWIDTLIAQRTSEDGAFNDRDEVYLTCSGAFAIPNGSPQPIELPRIAPTGSENYYGISKNETRRNIHIWTSRLAPNETIYLNCVIREQDNAQLSSFKSLVAAAATKLVAEIAGAGPVGDAFRQLSQEQVRSAAVTFYDSLVNDGDQNIGGFAVRLTRDGSTVRAVWEGMPETVSVAQDTRSTTIYATGSGAHYTARIELR